MYVLIINDYIRDLFIENLKSLKNSSVTKEDIIRIAEEYGIDFKSREAKAKIVDKIIESGFYDRLFQEFQEFIYVPVWKVAEYYGFRSDKIDQLRAIGVINTDVKEDSFYSRENRCDVSYNSYPLSVFNYNKEELEKAYNLAYGQKGYKIRIETTTIEEVESLTNELKKIFVIEYSPISYEHRNEKGYYSYLTVEPLNNSEYEGNKFLNEINRLKKEIKKIKDGYSKEREEIQKKYFDIFGTANKVELSIIKRKYDEYLSMESKEN